MKILQLIQKNQNRGAEIFACQLSKNLKNYGHEVKIVSIFKGENNLPWSEKIECLNANPNNRFFDFSAWKRLNKVVNTYNPDIIQANAADTLKYAVLSKIVFRCNTPIIFRNASEIGRYLKNTFQKQFNKFLMRQIDFVISVSQASKLDMLNLFPFLKSKIIVVPIGIEVNKLVNSINLAPENNHQIIHVGGFSFEKNHKGLLKIFSELLKWNSNLHLHLIGDGPLRYTIEKEIRVLFLQKYITIHGYVREPLPYIKAAKVLLLPSIIEGLPAVILEAMFCETSVVAYNVGGVSEVLNNRTGKIIACGDEKKFISSVKDTLQNTNESKLTYAKHLVETKFSNINIAREFIDVYLQVSKF